MYLPRRILLTPVNCGSYGDSEYAELGSTFKASHVKYMVWWIAYKVECLAAENAPCIMFIGDFAFLGTVSLPNPSESFRFLG